MKEGFRPLSEKEILAAEKRFAEKEILAVGNRLPEKEELEAGHRLVKNKLLGLHVHHGGSIVVVDVDIDRERSLGTGALIQVEGEGEGILPHQGTIFEVIGVEFIGPFHAQDGCPSFVGATDYTLLPYCSAPIPT